jgi:hypothetical protein
MKKISVLLALFTVISVSCFGQTKQSETYIRFDTLRVVLQTYDYSNFYTINQRFVLDSAKVKELKIKGDTTHVCCIVNDTISSPDAEKVYMNYVKGYIVRGWKAQKGTRDLAPVNIGYLDFYGRRLQNVVQFWDLKW